MIKKSVTIVLTFLIFLSLPVVAAEELSAKEWRALAYQRKVYFALGSIEAHQGQGVVFRHSMNEYIRWLDGAAAVARDDAGMESIFSELVGMQETGTAREGLRTGNGGTLS